MAEYVLDRFKEISFTQLRTFCECVRQGSYTAAARVLHLSQPAVWQQIRALERLAGVPLLERHGRMLKLTEEGRIFWEQALTVLGYVESFWNVFHERRQHLPKTLTVIATPALLSEELAQPIAAFHQAHPDVQLRLLSQHGLPVLEWLREGKADIAIVPADVIAFEDPTPFDRKQMGQRPATLVVHKCHHLAHHSNLQLEDVIQIPLILPMEDNYWFLQVHAVLQAYNLADRLRPVMRVSHILAAQKLVMLGAAAALMPMPIQGAPPKGLVYRKLDHLLPSLPLYLLARRGLTLPPHAQQFVQIVQNYLTR